MNAFFAIEPPLKFDAIDSGAWKQSGRVVVVGNGLVMMVVVVLLVVVVVGARVVVVG